MEKLKQRSDQRWEWKTAAKAVYGRHRILLILISLVLIMYGAEFGFIKSNTQNLYSIMKGETIEYGDTFFKGEKVTTSDKVLNDLINDDAESGQEKADEQLKEYENEKMTNTVTGRKSGIFAGIANDFSSGKLYMILFESLDSVIHSHRAASAIVVILNMLLSVAFWIFITNTLTSVIRRLFLEARLYDEVPVMHALYFRFVRRWGRASLTLLIAWIFEMLWYLTIVGGFIKRYSYRMVPYIVAENPDIKPLEAITLSRKMMDGHKWECFELDLSFILWYVLGLLTFGVADILWTVPYNIATCCEYYVYVRSDAHAKGIPGAELLNDKYLFEKAEEAFLRKTYSDIEEQKKFIDENRVTLIGAKAFFAKNFGLWIGSLEEKEMYDEVDNRRQQIVEDRAVIKGKIYPQRLSPLWKESNNLIVRKLRYIKTYTFWSVVLTFFFFAFVGWSYEVGIHLIKDGIFVNRGVMHGPWLPIYGGGVFLIVLLLAKWRSKPLTEAVSIVILCGFVEYTTSWLLEMTMGMRWWDYTGYFLNINGRICGEGLLVFAIGGMTAVYFLVPLLDYFWSKINHKAVKILCIVLLVAFLSDMVYSHFVPNTGEGITDYSAYASIEEPAQ